MCYCSSDSDYEECCGVLHKGDLAQSPESLMRSRYCAYVLGDYAYIQNTMTGQPLRDFNIEHAREQGSHMEWTLLEVLSASGEEKGDTSGYVEFVAHYLCDEQPGKLHEISKFEKQAEAWMYVSGQIKSS